MPWNERRDPGLPAMPPSYLAVAARPHEPAPAPAPVPPQVNVPKPRSEHADLSSLGLGGSGGAPSGAAPPPPPAAPRAAAPAAPAAAAAAPPPRPAAVPGYHPGLREISEASKLAKSATSALQFEDVATAVRLLSEALGLLTAPPRK